MTFVLDAIRRAGIGVIGGVLLALSCGLWSATPASATQVPPPPIAEQDLWSSLPAAPDDVALAASIARIITSVESYLAAFEHHSLDELREVREPITASEQAALQPDARTTVTFGELDVRTDGWQGVVRTHRTISVGDTTQSSSDIEIVLSRRDTGWIITNIVERVNARSVRPGGHPDPRSDKRHASHQ